MFCNGCIYAEKYWDANAHLCAVTCQDEKSCSYYMRTGTCKFGVACKFDHPQPASGAIFPLALNGSSAYGSPLSSVAPAPSMPFAGGIAAWPLSNGPSYMSNPRMQCLPAYMPVIIPPTSGTIPGQQGWTNYTVSSTI